ncbi:MAG: hypothetical protein OXN22_00795, partial [Deltaproteobacteria bacterium]|nr:hypothetical protein [Deltaproteobacteria bacterium]
MEQVAGWPRLRALRPKVSPLLTGLASIPLLVIFVLVAVLVWISFQTGILGSFEANYSLDNYAELLGDDFVARVTFNTLIFTIVTTLVALVIGLPIAWLTERTTLPGKGLVYATMT